MQETNKTIWALILNPHAGGGKGRRDKKMIENLLKSNGLEYDLLVSEYPRHAILLAKSAVQNGYLHFIVAGGDGTLNEVANGILEANNSYQNKVTIGVIPIGTGNDWIRTFGIPNGYQGAIDKITECKTFLQDIGKIVFSENGNEATRYFSNMAGFGFDALAAQKANNLKEKGHSGIRVYLLSILKAYKEYKTQRVQIILDGEKVDDLIFSASVGIGKFNGGGMMQAPGAIPNNGIFEVTIIKKIGIFGILRNLVGLYNGNFVKDPHVVCYRAKNISINSPDLIAGEVDGESLGNSQFHIEILHQKLQMIVGEIK